MPGNWLYVWSKRASRPGWKSRPLKRLCAARQHKPKDRAPLRYGGANLSRPKTKGTLMLTLARSTIAILLLMASVHSAPALPAIKQQVLLICGDAVLLGIIYADPKAAGTPVDFIVLAGKVPDGIHAIRSTKEGVFIGSQLCKPAKATFCPIEQNPTERTC
jgi:hypothetical protein